MSRFRKLAAFMGLAAGGEKQDPRLFLGMDPAKCDSSDALAYSLKHFAGGPKRRSIKLIADTELHEDDHLRLDGLTLQDSRSESDCMAFIPKENAVEFLESCIKVHALLKKRGLLPKKETDK